MFPGLRVGYRISSKATPQYNCIAWAAGVTDRWWWPNNPDGYWPDAVPAQETVAAFIRAYETLGYVVCAAGTLEGGFEKIAIYADATGKPKHAARQLWGGRWTSKLGGDVDIEHLDPGALNGPVYGMPAVFMHRPRHVLLRVAHRIWVWILELRFAASETPAQPKQKRGATV